MFSRSREKKFDKVVSISIFVHVKCFIVDEVGGDFQCGLIVQVPIALLKLFLLENKIFLHF